MKHLILQRTGRGSTPHLLSTVARSAFLVSESSKRPPSHWQYLFRFACKLSMAVTSSPDSHDHDPSTADDGSADVTLPEEEDEQEELHAPHSVSSSLQLLQQRISQTHPHPLLSPQALKLLGDASSHLSSSDAAPHLISSSCLSLLNPLYQQLESLRELIPLQPAQDMAQSSPSCLITSTLDYLDQLNREKEGLYEKIIQESSHCSNARNDEGGHGPSPSNVDAKGGLVKVEHMSDSNFHVHVQCKMREGLLSRLLFALESLGFVVDRMKVSCNQMLTLDATASKVKPRRLDGNTVQQVLQRTIDAVK